MLATCSGINEAATSGELLVEELPLPPEVPFESAASGIKTSGPPVLAKAVGYSRHCVQLDATAVLPFSGIDTSDAVIVLDNGTITESANLDMKRSRFDAPSYQTHSRGRGLSGAGRFGAIPRRTGRHVLGSSAMAELSATRPATTSLTPATSPTACPAASTTPDEKTLPNVLNLTGALVLTELSETVEDLAPLPAGLDASPAILSEPNWADGELNWALYEPYWSPGASGATLASGPALSGALYFQAEPLEAAAAASVPDVQSAPGEVKMALLRSSVAGYDCARRRRDRDRRAKQNRADATAAFYASAAASSSATATPVERPLSDGLFIHPDAVGLFRQT